MIIPKYLLICLLCCYGSCAVAAAAEVNVVHSRQVTDKQIYTKSFAKTTQKISSKSQQEPEQEEQPASKESLKEANKSIFSRMFGLLLPDALRTAVY